MKNNGMKYVRFSANKKEKDNLLELLIFHNK
ncbi:MULTISPECIES: DUF3892 domain-containing protein [Bacteria]